MIVQVNNRGKAVHNRINWEIYLQKIFYSDFIIILSRFDSFFIEILSKIHQDFITRLVELVDY